MRILVCGGRDYADHEKLNTVVSMTCERARETGRWPVTFISGAARGADRLIIDWCKRNETPCIEFPANWDKHGKAAGFIRNQQMLDEGKPDLVIAFPGGRGTADMIARARKAGVMVMQIR